MLGLICGLASEAEAAQGVPDACVGVSAASSETARILARQCIRDGATALVSFGLAGGLAPALPPGTIIIGDTVLSATGCWQADTAWGARLAERLPSAQKGPVWGCDSIVATAHEKHALHQSSRCLIADMESHAVAEIAAEAALPFAILRVVADSADLDLPLAALAPLKDEGRVDGMAVARSILACPWQLPALIRLGIMSNKAHVALRQAAQALAP